MTPQIATRGHAFILDELAELDFGIRAINARRKDLRIQIDTIDLNARLDAAKVSCSTGSKTTNETSPSNDVQLHAVIDGLRAKVGMPRRREDASAAAA
jgi:hypothetical protein